MAGNAVTLAAHVISAGTAVAMIGPNTRVKGQPGFAGTQVDVMPMSHGGAPGQWVVPNTRTRIVGNFMVSQSSQGFSVTPTVPPVTTPIVVPAGDARIRCL
jgi:hypothetical protein